MLVPLQIHSITKKKCCICLSEKQEFVGCLRSACECVCNDHLCMTKHFLITSVHYFLAQKNYE